MEETLGKRIVANRKRIGLTQDQLAERLGVTAQAVSKWENDQSCPDIATLPRLAEIFGITTDALLGREDASPVYQAEIVDDEDSKPHKGAWEFTWDAGKKDSLTVAVLVLLVGVLTLLSKVLAWDVSFWSILWPSALLVFGVRGLFSKFSFFSLGCGLFGGYFLISNLDILQIRLSGELAFPVILVLFGLSLLVDALRKPKKSKFHISRDGIKLNGDKESKSSFTLDTDSFDASLSFGDNTHYIDLPVLRDGDISCTFGELTIDLSGCMQVAEDCSIDASCSFGELVILVPRRFCVKLDSSSSFGALETVGQPDSKPEGTILLDASVSFGHIEVRYI